MSLISGIYKDIGLLDEVFGELIDSSFTIKHRYFYRPNNTNLQILANTFDINIKDEIDFVAYELCDKPILKKSKLGTYNGIKEAIFPIFGEINIKTHANDNTILPFNFTVEAKPNSSNIIDLKKAQKLINIYKPLRDNSLGIIFSFPNGSISQEIAAASYLRIKLSNQSRFNRTAISSFNYSIIAGWKLSF